MNGGDETTVTCAPATVEPFELIDSPSIEAGQETSHYDRSSLRIAAPGESIARVLNSATAKLGPGVEFSPDGATVVATVAGRVRLRDRRLWIAEVLEIHGDVDFSTGNVDFGGDVAISGGIIDLFKVISGGSIHVRRAIEAAEVRAAGDVVVDGGIIGKDKGHVIAGGDVKARFFANAWVDAGGDVLATTEIANSRITCGGRICADIGTILTGEVCATGGIVCQALGCPSGSRTIVEAGTDESFRQSAISEVAAIEARLKEAEEVRATVEPLLRNQRKLTAQQKEKATELLFNASEVADQCRLAVECLQRRKTDLDVRSKAEIIVRGQLRSGVIVRFPGLETTITAPLRGPVRLTPRGTGADRIIVAVNENSGHVLRLETRTVIDAVLMAVERVLRKDAA